MIYKQFHDLNIPHLGMGTMRLPTVEERGPIDEGKARQIIEYAYEHGINYLDWTLQDAKGKHEVITNHGIPVIVMEPCRGGRLASLNKEADDILKGARPNDSIASWAFRYLHTLSNVQVVLSGMTTMEQVKENTKLFSEPDPITGEERDLLRQATTTMVDLIPCTSCRYCCDVCQQEIDVPDIMKKFAARIEDMPNVKPLEKRDNSGGLSR